MGVDRTFILIKEKQKIQRTVVGGMDSRGDLEDLCRFKKFCQTRENIGFDRVRILKVRTSLSSQLLSCPFSVKQDECIENLVMFFVL